MPVVDPHSFHKVGKESAEGQAFVVTMYAARNDYLAASGNKFKVGSGATANVIGMGVTSGGSGGLMGVENVAAGAGTGTGLSESNKTGESNGAVRASVGLSAALGVVVWSMCRVFY